MTRGSRGRTYVEIDAIRQVHDRVSIYAVSLFEPDPVPLWSLRQITPSCRQSVRTVITRIPRVALDVLEVDPLTGSVSSFEEGEDVIDEFLVEDRCAVGFPPAVPAPCEEPFRQCCVGVPRGQDLKEG